MASWKVVDASADLGCPDAARVYIIHGRFGKGRVVFP